jgi:predicted DCC family thiol-disulfide oxidoreductase YuxK
MLSMDAESAGTLLYDADCGICLATAHWLRARVDPAALGVMAIDEAHQAGVPAVVSAEQLRAVLHFVGRDGTLLTGARAAIAAGRAMPGWRHIAGLVDHRLGYWLLEPLYREIASHRRKLSRALGLGAACAVPATQRSAESSIERRSRSRSGIR